MSKKLDKFLSDTLASLKSTIDLCGALESREGLPTVFEKIPAWVGLVQKILESAQSDVRAGHLDDDDDDVVKGLKNSKKHAEALESILKPVCTPSEVPPEERYKAVVKEQGRDDIVAATLHPLVKIICGLVEDDEIKTSEEDSNALNKALDEISGMVSGTKGSDATFHHSGDGDQINNTADGTIYLNKGGKQYNAKTQRFGK